MIRVIYDPYSGLTVPDKQIKSTVERFTKESDTLNNYSITFGSSLMVDYLLVLIKNGDVNRDNIELIFNGKEIRIDEDGNLDYPDDYPNIISEILMEYI